MGKILPSALAFDNIVNVLVDSNIFDAFCISMNIVFTTD